MKKIVLTTVCAAVMSGLAFAQGTVSWSTITPTFMTAQTNSTAYSAFTGGGSTGGGAVGGTSVSANGFYYELLYNTAGTQQSSPTTLGALNTWLDANQTAVNNAGTAGRLQTLNANTAATVPWANGTTFSIMLVGWSVNMGTTWSQALAALNTGSYGANSFFGVSTTGYINPNVGNPGATIWGSSANAAGIPINSPNTQLYLLNPVPEPGTMALAALGGASLLLFRRRK
jgi:hypothetical protein